MISSLVSAALCFFAAAVMAWTAYAHHDSAHPLISILAMAAATIALLAGVKDVAIYRWERRGR